TGRDPMFRARDVREGRMPWLRRIDLMEGAELSTPTFCTLCASCRHWSLRRTRLRYPPGLSGVSGRPMISRMTTTSRCQQRDDHRLRALVHAHSAFRGQTSDDLYFGTGDAIPADLTLRAAAARRARVKTKRSVACGTCLSAEAARMIIDNRSP